MLSRVRDALCNTRETKSALNTQQESWFLHVMPRQVIDSRSNSESRPSDMVSGYCAPRARENMVRCNDQLTIRDV
jgi:hypothetical protein